MSTTPQTRKPRLVPSSSDNDFDPDELALVVRDHHRDMGDLTTRVSALESRYGDDDRHGASIAAVCAKDKRIDDALKAILIRLIRSDPEIKSAVKNEINTIDRTAMRWMGNKVGFAVWTLMIIAVTAVIEHFVNH